MGVTNFTFELINKHLPGVKSVADLGDQMYYGNHRTYGSYMSEFFKEQGIEYVCYDLNGKNNAVQIDFSLPYTPDRTFDMVIDAGFSEHVGTTIEDYYQCWLNKWALCKEGGIIISENPMSDNWPGHGRHYLGISFYFSLSGKLGALPVLDFGMHPAMGNTKDGWNVWGVIRKDSEQFVTLEEFKQLPIFPR